MLVSPDAAEVRSMVDQTFRHHFHVPEDVLDELVEIPMVDDGRCIARSYRIDGYMAMWLIDIGLLQFYDAEGGMIRRANLLAELEPRAMAA
jgi:hypothetical protein